MSTTVLVIAALHAVPVVWSAYRWRTRKAVICASLLMLAIGVITGNPGYFAVDAAAVAIAAWFCWPARKTPTVATSAPAVTNEQERSPDGLGGLWIIPAVLIGLWLYNDSSERAEGKGEVVRPAAVTPTTPPPPALLTAVAPAPTNQFAPLAVATPDAARSPVISKPSASQTAGRKDGCALQRQSDPTMECRNSPNAVLLALYEQAQSQLIASTRYDNRRAANDQILATALKLCADDGECYRGKLISALALIVRDLPEGAVIEASAAAR